MPIDFFFFDHLEFLYIKIAFEYFEKFFDPPSEAVGNDYSYRRETMPVSQQIFYPPVPKFCISNEPPSENIDHRIRIRMNRQTR